MKLVHTNINSIKEYSIHLKQLPEPDRFSRFGYKITDYSIDQLMLNIVYNIEDHELWYAEENGKKIGWGHLAKHDNDSYELAVSVDHDYQRKGIGDKLIGEMLSWAKFRNVDKIFMHCIEENKIIQHLARKHKLSLKERVAGERTAMLDLPKPTFSEIGMQLTKEHKILMENLQENFEKMLKLFNNNLGDRQ